MVYVNKYRYTYASINFGDKFGYDVIKSYIGKARELFKSRIHPSDKSQLKTLQINLSQFIYSLLPKQKHDYITFLVFM